MGFVAICERLRPNMGRRQNKTYVNVARARQEIGEATAAEWVANNPGEIWSDPASNEFIIDLTEAEFIAFGDGTDSFTWGLPNLPRWQQQTDTSGDAKAFGNFADPESAVSAFTLDVPLVDDRFQIRLWNGNPDSGGVQVTDEEFTVGDGRVLRYVEVLDETGTRLTTNAANQRLAIGGALIDLDFGTSNSVAGADPPAGVATLYINTDQTGRIRWEPTDPEYRMDPAYEARIYTDELKALPI